MARLNYPALGGGGASPEQITQAAYPVGYLLSDYHSETLPQDLSTPVFPGTEWRRLIGGILVDGVTNFPALAAAITGGFCGSAATIDGDDIELTDFTGRVMQASGRSGATGADLVAGAKLGDRARPVTGTSSLLMFSVNTGSAGALSGQTEAGTGFYADGSPSTLLRVLLNTAQAPDNPTGPTNDPLAVVVHPIICIAHT